MPLATRSRESTFHATASVRPSNCPQGSQHMFAHQQSPGLVQTSRNSCEIRCIFSALNMTAFTSRAVRGMLRGKAVRLISRSRWNLSFPADCGPSRGGPLYSRFPPKPCEKAISRAYAGAARKRGRVCWRFSFSYEERLRPPSSAGLAAAPRGWRSSASDCRREREGSSPR